MITDDINVKHNIYSILLSIFLSLAIAGRAPCCLGQLRRVGRLLGSGGAGAVQLLLVVVDGAEREAPRRT